MSAVPKKIGRYEVLSELGRGAMGMVFKARDPVLDRLVALKTMSEALLVEDEMRERFFREARHAARLQHPNIVTISDLNDVDGVPVIAMELLEGDSLAQMVESGRITRFEDKMKIAVQICRGLDYAHKQGLIHRDIKPGNVHVLPDGTTKILDFGIAIKVGSTMLTKTGLVMGTPNYMAPEQIADARVDYRIDMWATGVIVYELVSGRRPFAAETIPSLVYQIVHAPVPQLDGRRLGIPDRLVAVLQRALEKERDKRFRDMDQMARALESVLGRPSSDATISDEARARTYTRQVELARSLLEKGEPARAMEAVRKAQALEPSRETVTTLISAIEEAQQELGSAPTVVSPPPSDTPFDRAKWVDEARLALTAGNRTEALRIVDDVLSADPEYGPAVELREILEKPAAPGRTRTRTIRSSASLRLRKELAFRDAGRFGEPPGIQVIASGSQPHLIAAGGVDGSVRLWDIETRARVGSFRSGHGGLVTGLAFSTDGAFLASGHVDGAVHLWRLDDGEELPVRISHDASIGDLAFSPDGNTLATGGLDSTLKLWDLGLLRQGQAQRRLIRQPAGVTALAYSLDGALVITGHTSRVLRVHDAAKGRLTATRRGPSGAIATIEVSPDGNHLATGAQDGGLHLYDLNRRDDGTPLESHKKAVTSLSYFPDGSQLASVAMDNSVTLWDVAKGSSRPLWGASGEQCTSVQVVGEEPWIVAGLNDGHLRIWVPQ